MSVQSVNRDAAGFYHWWLTTSYASEQKKYLQSRGITDNVSRQFMLGASPRYGDTLFRHLIKNHRKEDILSSGLVYEKDDGRIVDRFYQRIMYPIKAGDGEYIGFGARKTHGAGPKYINSRDTEVFHKGQNLYALDSAKRSDKHFFVLCEGYMDVIAMHKAGFTMTIASLGTSLTKAQAALLARYKPNVAILYDADKAGIRAAAKAAWILLEAGLHVYFTNLPEGKDPDEFLKKHSRLEMEQQIRASVKADKYLLMQSKKKFEDTGDIRQLHETLIKLYGKDETRIINAVNQYL